MTYTESIEWLFSTQVFGIKLGLDGTRRLLREARSFPKQDVQVIHVAGTNGKGSTCAMIDSLARACGRKTGLFTSPHLIDFRERIRVCGVEISTDTCAKTLTELRQICESLETPPTFFEITLVLAMKYFREQGCDLIVLETGLGGRLDATTAVAADVCVLTPVAMDHAEHLGNTLEKIAREKAGIILASKPVVSAPQEPAVRAVFEIVASELRAPIQFVSEPFPGPFLCLFGRHQRWNAALAIAALHLVGVPLPGDSVRYGLENVQWPGRFEIFHIEKSIVVLDGAHNPHAAAVLAEAWAEKFAGGQKAALVFSAVSSKDLTGILSHLLPFTEKIFFCPVDTPRARTAAEMALCLPENSPPHEMFSDFSGAFTAARQMEIPVLVAGSLFLVGEARALLTNATFQSSSQ